MNQSHASKLSPRNQMTPLALMKFIIQKKASRASASHGSQHYRHATGGEGNRKRRFPPRCPRTMRHRVRGGGTRDIPVLIAERVYLSVVFFFFSFCRCFFRSTLTLRELRCGMARRCCGPLAHRERNLWRCENYRMIRARVLANLDKSSARGMLLGVLLGRERA